MFADVVFFAPALDGQSAFFLGMDHFHPFPGADLRDDVLHDTPPDSLAVFKVLEKLP